MRRGKGEVTEVVVGGVGGEGGRGGRVAEEVEGGVVVVTVKSCVVNGEVVGGVLRLQKQRKF